MATPLAPTVRGRRKRGRLVIWVAVACLAAVVVEVGAVTDAFGLYHTSSTAASPPPDLNPGSEQITSVVPSVTYTGGGSDPFQFAVVAGDNICSQCPLLPRLDTNTNPNLEVAWIYFNVTYTGSAPLANLTTFAVSTNGTDPTLFLLDGLFLQGDYSESVGWVEFTPDETFPLALHLSATSIPQDGDAGYQLVFSATAN